MQSKQNLQQHLQQQWNAVKPLWQDNVAKTFEKKYLERIMNRMDKIESAYENFRVNVSMRKND